MFKRRGEGDECSQAGSYTNYCHGADDYGDGDFNTDGRGDGILNMTPWNQVDIMLENEENRLVLEELHGIIEATKGK